MPVGFRVPKEYDATRPRCPYCKKALPALMALVEKPIGEPLPDIGDTITVYNSATITILGMSKVIEEPNYFQNQKHRVYVWFGHYHSRHMPFCRQTCAFNYAKLLYEMGVRLGQRLVTFPDGHVQARPDVKE